MIVEFVKKVGGWRSKSQGEPYTKLLAEDLTRYEDGIHRAESKAVQAFEATENLADQSLWSNIVKPPVLAEGDTIIEAQEAIGILQLEAGASVPVGTPAGALIFVKSV